MEWMERTVRSWFTEDFQCFPFRSSSECKKAQVFRLREIVATMPEQWQKIYHLVLIDSMSKAAVGRILGISDVRVGQIVKKINAKIAADEELKKLFH